MTDLLTAKEMQNLLHVDRSTIYRMAEGQRLPAIKVGKQWRFPSDQVARWLAGQTTLKMPRSEPLRAESNQVELADLLPLDCIQLMQDTFAETLGVMLVVTDLTGQPVSAISNPCGLFEVINQQPGAIQKCVQSWQKMGAALELEPRLTPSHLGLLCARGLVRVGSELKGMVVAGGIAPPAWPPDPAAVQRIATEFGVKPEQLNQHLTEVFYLDEAEQAKLLSAVQRIANIVAHIINERRQMMGEVEAGPPRK